MIRKLTWIKIILEDVQKIADLDYQHRAWIDEEFKCPCHFEELMSSLYDSDSIEEFIETFENSDEFTRHQISNLKILHDKIEEFYYKPEIYFSNLPLKIDERKVLADPEWHEIRSVAQQVLDAFKDFDIREEPENDT